MIIDDVITAGTAIQEVSDIIVANGAILVGITVAMDRQERGTGSLSAIHEIEQNHQIKVTSIIDLQDIVDHLQKGKGNERRQQVDAVLAYRKEYGI